MATGLIEKYFSVSPLALSLFDQFQDHLIDWNQRVNLISRKDEAHVEMHHLVHSLAIAKVISFSKSQTVMDVGTGGGLPGIPLAILFPETQFLLVDSIEKKIRIVDDIVTRLNLKNVMAFHGRSEDIQEKFDFIVSRGVARLSEFARLNEKKIKTPLLGAVSLNGLRNGFLLLKGGELDEEIRESQKRPRLYPLSNYFSEEFFAKKFILHVPIRA